MAAVYEITRDKNWQADYDITVYQLGWRLGGKGASGRGAHGRIEEHGLHLFFGYYENAFRLMRDCYEELGRPKGAPLATWQDAFKKRSFILAAKTESADGYPWTLPFPENDNIPGDGGVMPTPWAYVEEMLQMIADLFDPWWKQRAGEPIKSPLHDIAAFIDRIAGVNGASGGIGRGPSEAIEAIVNRFTGAADELVNLDRSALAIALQLVRRLPIDARLHSRGHHRVLAWLVEHFRRWLGNLIARECKGDATAMELFMSVDLFASIVIGLIEHDMIVPPVNWHKIDNIGFEDWLRSAGVSEDTLRSGMLRLIGEGAFAEGTNGAAGTSVYCTLRLLFTYKGAVIWQMQAAMGDTIFAPLYEVLKRRGVKFEFFNSVNRLELTRPDAQGRREIARVVIDRQASLRNDQAEYDPLINLEGLPCWPSEPRYEQLVEGEAIQAGEHNLENWWGRWQSNLPQRVLEREKDFDLVICGIALGALPYIAKELIDDKHNPRFGRMVQEVQTTQTQAMQLWMKPTLKQLGWTEASPVVLGLPEPFDTWADMTTLLEREDWPKGRVNSLAYMCSRLPDEVGFTPPPRDDHDYPFRELERVKVGARSWIEQNFWRMWPKAGKPGEPKKFDWNLLEAPEGVEGVDRLAHQFLIADWNPSDRYVLATVGNGFHRLRPQDSGYANLVITGDWTLSSLSIGCVEAATEAGLRAARVVCGRPREIIGDWLDKIIPNDEPLPSWATTLGDPPPKSPAPYVRRYGDMLGPQPYSMSGTKMRWLFLQSDLHAIGKLCDEQLNIGSALYKPFLPLVAFVAADIAKARSLRPDRDTGYCPERECAFWVPLLAGTATKDGFKPERVVWLQPYTWVDSGAALTEGREIYGIAKSLGTLDFATGKPASFGVTTLVSDCLPTSMAHQALLVRAHEKPGKESLGERISELVSGAGMLATAITDGLKAAGLGGLPFDLRVLDDLLHGRMTTVTLKQIPSAETLFQASYQAVVEVAADPQGAVKTEWLPAEYFVDIRRYASHEVVQCLGLSVEELGDGWQRAKSLASFEMSFDFVFGRGRVITRTA
jgi:uncharacterized protein with NAD-binding domain and iron-sulfur cluster